MAIHAVFDHAETVARDIVTFWLRPEKPVLYSAGQFTELYLPHVAPDARGERRWFTLSSSPTEPLLGITTRVGDGDMSSYKRALRALQPEQEISLADPMGDFVLPKQTDIPLLFIAAGLGITPVRSMIQYLHDRGEQRTIRLLYAVPYPDEAAFLPLFTAYPSLELFTLVKHPPTSYQGETGSITTGRILQLTHDLTEPYIYLSGPEPLVEMLYKQLIAEGVPNERLITDYFPGYTAF